MVIVGNTISIWINQIKESQLDSGGFAPKVNGDYHSEATCWAILALSGDLDNRDMIERARARLAAEQLPDGRVCLSREHPEAFWPTYLAVLAWHQSADHKNNQAKAVHFLLETSGEHWPKKPDAPIGHDPDLKGWSWIDKTHSWVEPTGLAIMALRIAGYGNQARVREGTRLLLDRQLPHGGWNYGNTFVYGQELRPMPLSTGIALNALKNEIPLETIQGSLTYLKNKVITLQTPRSLGWSILGLATWQARPESAQSLIYDCLMKQDRYGVYDTSSLALLLVAFKSPGGIEDIFLVPEKS